jgi:hypothetical protein
MTVEANASASTPGSGAYPAVRTPLGVPALPTPCAFAGVPCSVVQSALVEPALVIAERANTARLRVSHGHGKLLAWLAARGVTPTGGAPRPSPDTPPAPP